MLHVFVFWEVVLISLLLILICLWRGKDLIDVLPQLEQGKRVMVASVIIRSKKEIQTKQIEEVLLTAANWQEEAKRLKISMINTKKKTAKKK